MKRILLDELFSFLPPMRSSLPSSIFVPKLRHLKMTTFSMMKINRKMKPRYTYDKAALHPKSVYWNGAKDKWIANSAYISDDEDMDHNLNSDDNYNSADEYNARGIGLNREDNHGKYVHVGRKRRAQTPPSPCQRQGLTHTYSQASKRSRFLNN